MVVTSQYDIDVFKETIIRGNDALLKCEIPSFVSDLVFVEGWVTSEGIEIRANVATDSFDNYNNFEFGTKLVNHS